MRKTLFTFQFYLLVLASTAATAATVYKWVDENGVTHFSDQPHENAQKVELKAPQTFSAPKTAAPSSPTPARQPPQKVYQSCSMSEPANDQVFLKHWLIDRMPPGYRTGLVFIDDSPVHVAAAREAGWHGIQYHGVTRLRHDLGLLSSIADERRPG